MSCVGFELQLRDQPVALFGLQPFGLRGLVRQILQHAEAEQDRGQGFEDVEHLPVGESSNGGSSMIAPEIGEPIAVEIGAAAMNHAAATAR